MNHTAHRPLTQITDFPHLKKCHTIVAFANAQRQIHLSTWQSLVTVQLTFSHTCFNLRSREALELFISSINNDNMKDNEINGNKVQSSVVNLESCLYQHLYLECDTARLLRCSSLA